MTTDAQVAIRDEQYETDLLDLAIMIHKYGGKKLLNDLLEAYPNEFMELTQTMKGNSRERVAALFRAF